jgi:hypothetical protein
LLLKCRCGLVVFSEAQAVGDLALDLALGLLGLGDRGLDLAREPSAEPCFLNAVRHRAPSGSGVSGLRSPADAR